MWTCTLCLEKAHTSFSLDLSLSLTHTHAGEGRISLRHSSRSGDEWCGRSCRRYGSLLLVAVEGSFL